MTLILSFFSGLLFGLGLLVSNMANPEKVLGFLDVFGKWDPSLLFVMLTAIIVGTIAFTFARKRTMSLLGTPIQLPASTYIDHRLIIGNVLFGIGWGLAGICPGPALVLLGAGIQESIPFVLCMLIGMKLFDHFNKNIS